MSTGSGRLATMFSSPSVVPNACLPASCSIRFPLLPTFSSFISASKKYGRIPTTAEIASLSEARFQIVDFLLSTLIPSAQQRPESRHLFLHQPLATVDVPIHGRLKRLGAASARRINRPVTGIDSGGDR